MFVAGGAMARTVPQLVALAVIVASATVGTELSISQQLAKLTGTLGLADVQQILYKADPDDRFLLHDALDDDGVGTTRVQTHGTIRVTIPLPSWVTMADDPAATHVAVFRGIPSTRNTPALDPILNHDGRPVTVEQQALGAIRDHYQNTVEPTSAQLDAIAT